MSTDYTYTSYDAPPGTNANGSNVWLYGLNNSGSYVGYTGDYRTDAQGFMHSSTGGYTAISYPGAAATTPADINDRGQIVGSYRNADTSAVSYGFSYDGTTYQTLSVPGSRFTEVNGVNNAGVIVGDFIGADGKFSGFSFSNGQYASFTVPGAGGTYATGVNDSGQIVGYYDKPSTGTGPTQVGGFIYANGSFQKVDYPGADSTSFSGINNNGKIIGTAVFDSAFGSAGGTRAFTYQNGVFEDVPARSDSVASIPPTLTGINDSDQLLGVYNSAITGRSEIFSGTPLCFVTGTLIRTARGDVPVEALMVGDLAVTASGGLRPVRWIGHRALHCAAETAPVRVRAGAFGAGLPERDLYLSPGHPVLVGGDADHAGGVLVPVMCLVNGLSITRTAAGAVTYWHVELDAHDLLLAEGLPAESYHELGSRAWFAGGDAALSSPELVPAGQHGRCLPVALDGPVIEAERRRLDGVFAMQQAALCGWPSADMAAFTP